MLGIAQRRGFRIDDAGRFADIRRLENRQSLGIGCHHAVFDAVMHHFDEMAGAARPAMQIALLGRAAGLFASRRARDVAAARREGGEDRVEMPHHVDLAADHHAIAALQAPDAAAGADVDVVDALGRQLLGPADVVDVIGVAAVDQDVAALQMGQQIGDGFVHHADRHHQPDRARLRQAPRELRQRSAADSPLLHELRHSLRGHVEHRALMAALQQAPHHVRSHPAEADHSQLHGVSPPWMTDVPVGPDQARRATDARRPSKTSTNSR